MTVRYEASTDALAQLEGWWRWLRQLGITPTLIKIAPDVELDLIECMGPLLRAPSNTRLATYRGARVEIDEALAPRGVQLS